MRTLRYVSTLILACGSGESMVVGCTAKQIEFCGQKLASSTRDVECFDSNVSDFTPLRVLDKLERLSLSQTSVRDLGALGGLKRLRKLALNGSSVVDLTALAGLESLEDLDLSNTGVKDLSPIDRLKSLRVLRLGGTRVKELAPIKDLRTLEHLVLADCPVRDLTPLRNCTGLRHLDLSGTKLGDLTPLGQFVHLEKLQLSGTQVTDLSGLGRMTRLAELDLRDTPVWDLAPLAGLRVLQALNLEGTYVKDLAPLAKLASLSKVSLERTLVRDFGPLLQNKRVAQGLPAKSPMKELDLAEGWCNLEHSAEVLGLSPDGSAAAVRLVQQPDEGRQETKCRYPKVSGIQPAAVDLYLCRKGAGCERWNVYAAKRACTPEQVSTNELRAAKAAFASAGVNLGSEFQEMNKGEKNGDGRVQHMLPEEALGDHGISGTVTLGFLERGMIDDESGVSAADLTVSVNNGPSVVLCRNEYLGFPGRLFLASPRFYPKEGSLVYFLVGGDECGTPSGPHIVNVRQLAQDLSTGTKEGMQKQSSENDCQTAYNMAVRP